MFNNEDRYALYNRMDFSGYNSLMNSLQSVQSSLSIHDDVSLMQSLAQLSSDLSIAQEDFLSTIPLPQLIAVLIQCLHKENIPDIPLYAMNSLVSVIDSLPHASGIIVQSGGISILSSKLMNFDFIDLAELSIKVLEKISYENSMAIVKEGAFESMINMMEFFESSVQKRILNISVNISKMVISRDVLDRVRLQVPVFVRLLEFRGNEGVMQNEKALDFVVYFTENFVRIVGSGEETLAYFNQLKEFQVICQVIDLISNSSSLLLKSIKLLRVITKHSATMCCDFLSMGGSDVIKEVLSKPHEDLSLVTETLKLANAIIPSIESDLPVDSEKLSIFKDRPQYLNTLTEMILPRAIIMFEELISNDSKIIVIEILEKLIRLCPEDELRPLVSTASFSTFISEVLSSKEYKMIENGLKIVNTLYDKMIDTVLTNFIREGVYHRVKQLSDPSTIKNIKPPKPPASEFPLLRRFFMNSETEPNERQMFEELMNRINNRNSEAANEGIRSFFSMIPQEPKINVQQNLLTLTNNFLEKHKSIENKEAYQPGKNLMKIVKSLGSLSGDNAFPVLIKLINSLSCLKRFSYYEVCNSKLAETILKWLSDINEVNPDVLLKRLVEFLGLFIKVNSTGETHMSVLISLLIGALHYVQHFSISVSSSTISTRKLTQKHRLQFVYTPDSDIDLIIEKNPELASTHYFFLAAGQFLVTTGTYTSFDTIKNSILTAKSVKDLNNLKDHFKTNTERRLKMEYLGEYSDEEDFDPNYKSRNSLKDANENPRFSINMTINNLKITKGMTIYEALLSSKSSDNSIVKFKLCVSEEDQKLSEFMQSPLQLYMSIIHNSIKIGLDNRNKALPYLTLLKMLYEINDHLPIFIPQMFYSISYNKLPLITFKSAKLTSLLSRQIQEQNQFLSTLNIRFGGDGLPVSGALPFWIKYLPDTCKFLFPYLTREGYLYSFKIRMSVVKLKVRVNRLRLLEDAIGIMNNCNLIRQGCLEIDYENEVGTGIGPSMEFFSLVSNEIRKLPFWRKSEDSRLFPLPISATSSNWKEYFNFFGRFVAKALIDKRQIDLPFSPVFWKLVLNQPITLLDLIKVDKQLGQTLIDLQEMLIKCKTRNTKALFKGVSLESLGLVFTLPGFDEIELKPLGKNCYLNLDNVEEYINLVTSCTLLQTLQAQAFRQGFEALLSSNTLNLFTEEEMEDLLCGQVGIQWNMSELQQYITPAHGYTVSSPVFYNLLITMTELTLSEQRKFLQFITGSPRLPVGGFSSLNPRLTVVRKEPSIFGMHPDEYLPSVMTCQNYLKLPEYSSIEILQQNLKYAINEGHESFHLS
ncbi:hypothetical protein SteCoe_21528 [Stentor coeruleus]|uniref:HECT-type E3 ubiquitin transferase n=1 Tax=Stentor coeruleus TaxID=5963 RepID=A0A1R2BPE5_9CILI|nr:hypothetical protein SteCoe_21528 [Stentor coeruleus]